ncbi:hypothetical protein GCM10010994_09600 [Chelatococcus reniformis]|uniref:Uncharacterized protein n=1 Tax=Chelatococcus reniformis TaxID=1494448 RepID=A0A916TYY7_9HYPH|nr:hypothetical protein GCM10010994_09600 [Chelatococcus reniformis]
MRKKRSAWPPFRKAAAANARDADQRCRGERASRLAGRDKGKLQVQAAGNVPAAALSSSNSAL